MISKELLSLILDKEAISGPNKLKKGSLITKEYLSSITHQEWLKIKLKDETLNVQLETVAEQVEQQRIDFNELFEEKRKKITRGDDLKPGFLRMVRCIWPLNVVFNRVIKWPVVMVTKVLSR